MNKIIGLLIIALLPLNLFAQSDTTYWNVGGLAGVNVTQSSLTNWAAGGTNSVSGNSYFNLIADYKKGKHFWNNSLDLGYGLIKEEGRDAQKTEDKIVLISNYGRQLSDTQDKWFFSALLDFRTQFDVGEEITDDGVNKISNFMAPGYLITSIGLDWKPKSYFSVKFGFISSKLTFVLDEELSDAGAYGLENPGDQVRFEGGGLLGANFNKEILENVQYVSNLTLFSNYEKSPEKIDVNWENTLNLKINNYLTANIYNQLIYDYDVKFDVLDADGNLIDQEERVQFKNIIGIGLAYKFGGSRG